MLWRGDVLKVWGNHGEMSKGTVDGDQIWRLVVTGEIDGQYLLRAIFSEE